MAGIQTDNLLLLDLTTGLSRTPELGGTPDIIETSNDWEWVSGASVVIDGNLTVNGTTVTIQTEQVNIRDNHLYLNADYTVAVAQTGGFVVNVLPTATVDTVAATGFVARAGAANATVSTTGAVTFSAGDIIQIDGANNQSNDGLFEVESHAANVLTIRGLGTFANTQDWFQNDFVTDTTVAGGITVVNVNVLRGNSSGDWESYTGATTTGLTYTTFTQQGLVDLQVAYVEGNTITTSAGEGNVTIAGTETFVVTTTGGINLDSPFDFDSTSFDVQMTGSNGFSIDGTAASNVSTTAGNLTLSTITSGTWIGTSAADLSLSATTSMGITTKDLADASANDITLTAGSSTAGTAAGASIILTPGDGFTTGVAGSVDITGPNNEDESLFTLESTGTNGDKIQMFVGDSDPSGSVTALAGSLFFRDTGTGAELYLNTSTGSGMTWVALSTAAGATLQTAYIAGNTITTSAAEGDVTFGGTENFVITLSDLLVDTTASISLDADTASNFTVAGAALTLSTTTSGAIDVTSAGILDLDSVGALSINSSGGVLNLGNDANAFGINIGTGAAARTITMGNATGATSVNFDSGTAGFTFDSTVSGAVAFATVTTSGAAGDSIEWFVSDTDPSAAAGIAAPVGSTLWRDSAGTGTVGELWVKTGAADTAWSQVATGDTTETLQEAYVAGNTIVTSAPEGPFDVSGTQAISLDASLASNFSVASATLTLETTGAGTLAVTSADDIVMTFETANTAAMVLTDGTNTYLTMDSTVAEPAVELSQFVDIVGSGAGVTLTAGQAIAVGEVVTIETTTGDAILADSNTGTTLDGLAIGVAAFAAADTAPVKVYTVAGSLIPINFAAAPAAASNGRPVFVSATPGEATLTAPTGSGNVVYLLGILQGADGADTSPLVLFQPQFIAVRT